MPRESLDYRIAVAVGARIRLARHAVGYTQAQVAERTGYKVAATTLARYETGAHNPSVERLLALAAALHCDPGDLLPTPAEIAAVSA